MSLMGVSSRVATIGLTITSTLILARRLGPDGMGEYFLFVRVVALLAVLADLGFSQGTRVFAGRGESSRQIHSLLIRFSICSSIVVLLVFVPVLKLFGSMILPNYPLQLQIATTIALPFILYSNLWKYMMVGFAQIGPMNLVQIGSAATTLLLVITFVSGLSRGLPAAVTIYTGMLVIQAMFMAAIASSIGGDARSARKGLFREMFRFGLRGAGSAIATLLCPRMPVFMLNVFQGQAAVGVFSVGQQLTEKLLLPMEAVQDAIYGKMARLPPADAKTVMNRYVRISGWSMCIFVLMAAVALPIAVVVVLGPQYRATVPVVLALIPGAAVMSTPVLLSTFFVAQLGKPGLISILAGISLGIIVLLSAALIPANGPIGAALAVSGAQIIATVVVATIYVRTTGSRFLELVKIDRSDRDLFQRQVFLLLGRPEE